jgi:hypothetical protein
MNILDILKKNKIERDDIKYNLLGLYFKKSEKWLKKHDDENDFFDRYLSLFIAVNITYELWRKIVNEYPDYEDKRDFKNLSRDLIDDQAKINTADNFSSELFALIERENLYIEVGSKKNKKEVQKAFNEFVSIDDRFEIIWESFYSVRCNLIHGEKGYDDKQKRLLGLICPQLKACLINILTKLKILNYLLSIHCFIHKNVIIESEAGKRYKILDIDSEKITILREDAKDKEREYIILMKDIYCILCKFYNKYSEINTTSIKKYVGGLQSPVIAILKYCEIIK